jgi:hypothetical protein
MMVYMFKYLACTSKHGLERRKHRKKQESAARVVDTSSSATSEPIKQVSCTFLWSQHPILGYWTCGGVVLTSAVSRRPPLAVAAVGRESRAQACVIDFHMLTLNEAVTTSELVRGSRSIRPRVSYEGSNSFRTCSGYQIDQTESHMGAVSKFLRTATTWKNRRDRVSRAQLLCLSADKALTLFCRGLTLSSLSGPSVSEPSVC